jgi:hypothetical protein
MARIKAPNWIAEGPLDLEYKSYKLLSEIERLKGLLKAGNLFDVLNEVDQNLDYLYLYDAEKITQREDLSNFELIGIDPQNFQLMFNDDALIQREQILDDICDQAIDKFESLHAEVRELWRQIEETITCTYVPHKGYFLTDGFAFIITANNKLHIYYFIKPNKYTKDSWKDFKLQFIQAEDFTKELYMQRITEILENNEDRTILKIECKADTKIEGNAIAVIQNKIFNQLRRDFAF